MEGNCLSDGSASLYSSTGDHNTVCHELDRLDKEYSLKHHLTALLRVTNSGEKWGTNWLLLQTCCSEIGLYVLSNDHGLPSLFSWKAR